MGAGIGPNGAAAAAGRAPLRRLRGGRRAGGAGPRELGITHHVESGLEVFIRDVCCVHACSRRGKEGYERQAARPRSYRRGRRRGQGGGSLGPRCALRDAGCAMGRRPGPLQAAGGPLQGLGREPEHGAYQLSSAFCTEVLVAALVVALVAAAGTRAPPRGDSTSPLVGSVPSEGFAERTPFTLVIGCRSGDCLQRRRQKPKRPDAALLEMPAPELRQTLQSWRKLNT